MNITLKDSKRSSVGKFHKGDIMSDDEKYNSSVYLEEEEIDSAMGTVRKRRVVSLKGQETTEKLLSIAKKEMERD